MGTVPIFYPQASGDLSAIYLKDDGVRVYYVDGTYVSELGYSYSSGWYRATTAIEAAPSSPVSAAWRADESGKVSGIAVVYLAPTLLLREMNWLRERAGDGSFDGESTATSFSKSAFKSILTGL